MDKIRNIVMFFCDELRADALGCYGNPVGPMKTPNIDSLAEKGTLFENCFCNSPICIASRASLITGTYPEANAVYDNEAALSSFRLPGIFTTFPEEIAKAGWRTASFGKTHLPEELHPFETDDPAGGEMHLGLTRQEAAGLEKVRPRGKMSFNAASLYPEGKTYFPEKVTENALSWMNRQTEPYFVRLSYLQPHSPVIVKRGYETIYKDYPFSGKLPDISNLSEFEQAFARAVSMDTLTEEEVIKAKVYYYGMVCWIDDEIGKVLTHIRSKGEEDNTLFILTADHGALRGEVRGLGKHVFERHSQQVPLILAGPGVPVRQRRSENRSLIDLAPTVLSLLGIRVPDQFVGTDLLNAPAPEAVYGTKGFGETDSCAFPNRALGRLSDKVGWPRRSCIRMGKYRLDMTTKVNGHYASAEEEDLFFTDTEKYPAEDVNLIHNSNYAAIAARMLNMLRGHCANPVEVPAEAVRMPSDTAAHSMQ